MGEFFEAGGGDAGELFLAEWVGGVYFDVGDAAGFAGVDHGLGGDGLGVAGDVGLEPAEAGRVVGAVGVVPAGGDVAEAVFAEGAPDGPGEGVG